MNGSQNQSLLSPRDFAKSRYYAYLCSVRIHHASHQNSVPGWNFFICRYMKYNKQPLDIPAQIAMLKGRGLVIADEQAAEKALNKISYFRLAAYLRPMEADKNV